MSYFSREGTRGITYSFSSAPAVPGGSTPIRKSTATAAPIAMVIVCVTGPVPPE